MTSFDAALKASGRYPLRARSLSTMQVNLGKLCNQVCKHCHVDAGPQRTGEHENMSAEGADLVLAVLEKGVFTTLDLTGGAPELNPNFRRLVRGAVQLEIKVIDRCNLSVLYEPGQDGLAQFLVKHRVEIVASLPFYTQSRTDAQRGKGVFDKSIEGLKLLCGLGYGQEGSGLILNLVYNPGGAYLPAPQAELEAEFGKHLLADHGIRFNQLFSLTNLPVKRFLDYLKRSGNEASYREKLSSAFNPVAADEVMCRDLISVAPDGSLYDCDFNQMLEIPLVGAGHLRDLLEETGLAERRVVTASHCFGCTAGAGSSCGGAIVTG